MYNQTLLGIFQIIKKVERGEEVPIEPCVLQDNEDPMYCMPKEVEGYWILNQNA